MQRFISHFLAALGGGLLAALVVAWALGNQKVGSGILLTGAAGRQELYPARLTDPAADYAILPGAATDLRPAARRATPAVVHVDAKVTGRDRATVKALFSRNDEGGKLGSEGSGVIYSADGYIVTNYHVIQATDDITVITSDRRRYAATIVGSEPKSDLAVLKIDAEKLPYLELTDSDRAEAGQWVLAVGSPLGLTSTVTAGIVSAKGRNLSILPDLDAIESFIQTDAAVNPGNSGGPLVDASGKMLGINTAIATRNGLFQGYSFAIPSNLVRRIVDDIIEYGSYRRAIMGIEISTLTAGDIERLELGERSEGVLVNAVFPGGAAARGGLLPNDLIVEVDGRIISDLPELTEIIGRARPGNQLILSVVRGNKLQNLTVTLMPAETD